MGLNERQVAAVLYVVEHNSLTSGEYQDRWNISRATAGRELGELVEKGIHSDMERLGGIFFIQSRPAQMLQMPHKCLINASNAS